MDDLQVIPVDDTTAADWTRRIQTGPASCSRTIPYGMHRGMTSTLLIAAAWMLYTTGVHALIGGRLVAGPLRSAALAPFPQATLLVVWHGVTWLFLTIAGALALGALHPGLRVLAPFAALQLVGLAVIFLVVARRLLGSSIRLPQWFLLGPLAIVAASTLAARSNAVAAAAILAAMGAVHAGWAAGLSWPARDAEELALHVIGLHRMPSRSACALVALTLGAFAGILLVERTDGSVMVARVAIVAVFAARGVLGLVEARLRPVILGKPYATYSRLLYSPLCLLIAALAAGGMR